LIDRLLSRDAGFWEGQASGAAVLTTTYGSSPDRESILPQVAAQARQDSAGNSVVFSAMTVRMMLLAEAAFKLQRAEDGSLYGSDTSLHILEHPWPEGSSGELIARLEQDAGLAGNAYMWAPPGEGRLVRLRPDYVTIISELVRVPGGGAYRRKVGYWHEPPKGVTGEGDPFEVPAAECCHFAPLPDPFATFRGMSWLTPVHREVAGDDAMTGYKIRYLQNNASPNLLIKYAQKLAPSTVDRIRERVQARYGGPGNAGGTLVLDQGADATIIGNSLSQMSFDTVQSAGAERILAAAGVPPLVVGLESIKGAGKSYEEVIRRFADLTLRPEWRAMCAALETVTPAIPPAVRLWVDTAAIAALQDGQQVRAQVSLVHAQALLTLSQAGYDRDSAVKAVNSGDITLLKPDPAAVAPP
ncbi:MAG TPA: phage portal protein, partial [Streptosporangiaceae bacterium]|nr:phage portal protein [Streptosporangiaceae bacterium]